MTKIYILAIHLT